MSTGSKRFQTQIFVASLENGGLPALTEELHNEDVELVLDIRRWPARHWRRYAPHELARQLAAAEVYYLHRPDLGPESRHWQAGGDHWKLNTRSYRRLLHSNEAGIASVAGLALRHRTCIVSQFAAPNDRDRRLLAENVGQLAGLRTLVLRARPKGQLDPRRPPSQLSTVSAAHVALRWLDIESKQPDQRC